jgi:hypothetical protein
MRGMHVEMAREEGYQTSGFWFRVAVLVRNLGEKFLLSSLFEFRKCSF